MKLALNLSHRLLGRDQEAQNRAAVRLRDDCERRFHSLSIPHRAYACQGIYDANPGGREKLTAELTAIMNAPAGSTGRLTLTGCRRLLDREGGGNRSASNARLI